MVLLGWEMKIEYVFSVWEDIGNVIRVVYVYWFGWKFGVSNVDNNSKGKYRYSKYW